MPYAPHAYHIPLSTGQSLNRATNYLFSSGCELNNTFIYGTSIKPSLSG